MSRVQFNLLPDVKLNFVKAQQIRNRVISVAILVSGVALALFLILLFGVNVVQKKQLSDADKEVASATHQLQALPNLNNVLTIQNQLNTLSSLHGDKHISSRVFSYLSQVTPTNVRIGSLAVDFAANTLDISGTADSQHAVNTFIDTLKFTTYKLNAQDSNHRAFPSVIESSFSIANDSAYSLKVQFDPPLFANNLSEVPSLTVPQLTSTRASNDPSNVLFNGQTDKQGL